jgi:hypothetical protein
LPTDQLEDALHHVFVELQQRSNDAAAKGRVLFNHRFDWAKKTLPRLPFHFSRHLVPFAQFADRNIDSIDGWSGVFDFLPKLTTATFLATSKPRFLARSSCIASL